MSITDILNPSDIAAALKECEAPDTFNYKKFFQTCGLVKKAPHEVKTLFQFVDNDRSGFVEEQEMLNFLQRFDPSARLLTSAEATEFMAAADRDRDGKIGADEFQAMVHS
ncbi:parvalbumin, thymic CPV3-like [Spea bombifrons]|uniref:parvalbumin, thymic CPV3-like n=1 Tax=Spea bombifrons TaxID=233779 RepID=UPI00234BC1D0|nr:parvalbumin, thymic CPV3-like [Spea bombifrons]